MSAADDDVAAASCAGDGVALIIKHSCTFVIGNRNGARPANISLTKTCKIITHDLSCMLVQDIIGYADA